ncbi:MAG: hypothetical protein L3J56_03555, partial [Bacteroidales bacterium]|nr:hypothetical protein [Bacteroidales bacterium]
PFKQRRAASESSKKVHALYVNLDFITYKGMDVVARMLKTKKVNSIVINFKDDTGNLIYGTTNHIGKEAKASVLHYKLKRFLRTIKPYDP